MGCDCVHLRSSLIAGRRQHVCVSAVHVFHIRSAMSVWQTVNGNGIHGSQDSRCALGQES